MKGKTTLLKKIMLLVFCAACLWGTASQAQAKHTSVGVAASSTYVKENDSRQVILYVGDSRSMYMTCGGNKNNPKRRNFAFAYVNGGNVTCIDKNGSLTPYVEELIEKYRKRDPVIVFNFGLNGNGKVRKNAKRIIRIYRKWMKDYPDLRFVVESVNPTILSKGSYSDKKVVKLNRLLQKEFEPDGIWMDNYTYIIENRIIRQNGYGMRDNYHYKWKTCKKLLVRIRSWVEENIV